MTMLVLCAALILTALPAAANYTGDKNLTENFSGIITGEMNYTIGDSYYSPKMWSNDDYVYTTTILEAIPNNAEPVIARLYVYWSWSFNDTDPTSTKYDTGVPYPEMNVTINGGQPLALDARYNDTKDFDGYNYPAGTYCYDVIGNVTPGGVKSYVVNITNSYNGEYNQSFNIAGVGLLTLYNYTSSEKEYRIAEGHDMLYDKYNTSTSSWENGIPPTMATSYAFLTDLTENENNGTLTTVVPFAGTNPPGGTAYNVLFFNDQEWVGLWDGIPRDNNFAYETVNVTVIGGNNTVGFRDGVDNATHTTDLQMDPANAFLLHPL